jgi:hypothetical protein
MDMQTLIRRVRGEYLEMPGLNLTLAQACRLWQMDAVTCQAALDALIAERFLGRTRDGAFVLVGPAVGPVPRMAKASLRLPSHHAVA